MKPQERQRTAKAVRLCLVCLKPSSKDHQANDCKSKFICKCGGRHNYLLHFEFANPRYSNPKVNETEASKGGTPVNSSPINSESQNTESKIANVCAPNRKLVLLPTVIAKFKSGDRCSTCRVMLDSCSQATLIADTFVRKHQLATTRSSNPGPVKVGGEACHVSDSVFITIMSKTEPFELCSEAEVVPASSLSYSVNRLLPASVHNQLRQFSLADEALLKPDIQIPNVDILLSAEFYERCLYNETRTIDDLGLSLTRFGWTAIGATPPKHAQTRFAGLTIREINDNLQKFWELEQPPAIEETKLKTIDCVAHFENTAKVTDDNRFEVRLPFKLEKSKVADNRRRAKAALFALEKRLSNSVEYWPAYVRFMKEYADLGHMELVDSSKPNNDPKYYIPHLEAVSYTHLTLPTIYSV